MIIPDDTVMGEHLEEIYLKWCSQGLKKVCAVNVEPGNVNALIHLRLRGRYQDQDKELAVAAPVECPVCLKVCYISCVGTEERYVDISDVSASTTTNTMNT